MSRVAIIGSCITRDLWPILGEAPGDLLYISRTSLASLFAPALSGLEVHGEPPNGLRAQPHAALVADLRKTGVAALLAHKPTHIIFDFIDERFDLLAVGDRLAVHSWELEVSGYLDQATFHGRRVVARASEEGRRLWREGAAKMAAILQTPPLADAAIILHEAQWAQHYVDASGTVRRFDPIAQVFEGKATRIDEQNALLGQYQDVLPQLIPRLARVAAPDELRVADEKHRWGLSPFHYVEDYYRHIWPQLRALGV